MNAGFSYRTLLKYCTIFAITITATTGINAQKKARVEFKDSKGNPVYTRVETIPQFPNGEAELFHYLSTNIKYPEQARKDSVSGTVYVGFVVERDGSIIDVKIKRGVGGGCDEEAMRVIEKMPHWIPGKQDGKAIAVAYTVPIKFKLDN